MLEGGDSDKEEHRKFSENRRQRLDAGKLLLYDVQYVNKAL